MPRVARRLSGERPPRDSRALAGKGPGVRSCVMSLSVILFLKTSVDTSSLSHKNG